jgi:O-antigen/teichoic acid export membrane protein
MAATRRLDIRSVATLASGAAVAQSIGIVFMPVLTRYYGPADFGLYGVLMLSSQLLALALAGRYEQTIMLAKRAEGRSGMALMSLLLAVVSGAFALIVAAIFSTAFDRVSGLHVGWGWCLVVAAAVIISFNSTLSIIAIRDGRSDILAKSRIAKAISTVAAQFAFVLLFAVSFKQWGLVLGEIVALVASTALLALQLRDVDTLQFRPRAARRGFRAGTLVLIKRYRKYPLVNLPHAFLSAAVGLLTLTYISLQFSPADAGQYFVMFRVVMLPASLIGTAVSQIYFRSAAEHLARDGNFWRLLLQVVVLLGAIGAAICAVLMFGGSVIFPLVLGDQWREAGVLAEILAPYVAIHLIISALAPTIMVTNVLGQAFYASLGQSATFLLGLFLGQWAYGTITGAVAMAVYFSVPYMAALLVWYGYLARGVDREL